MFRALDQRLTGWAGRHLTVCTATTSALGGAGLGGVAWQASFGYPGWWTVGTFALSVLLVASTLRHAVQLDRRYNT